MAEKKLSFEKAVEKLEYASDRLKSSDLSLEESIKVYEDSLKYYKICNDILNEAKQRIEVYRPETGETEDFDD